MRPTMILAASALGGPLSHGLARRRIGLVA